MDKPRILIVDDEEEAGQILSLRLGRRGYVPAYVTSGEAALAHLAQNEVEVVVLDVKMPGMDGFETLKRIREGHPDVSVVILSGHADVEDAARGMELGAFFYLLKPVNLEELCNKIEDALRLRAMRGGARR
jgi:DNA-binding response OmpR family regulator